MTNLLADPQLLTAAAADTQQINAALSQARAAAAGPTTSVAAAAADEISAAAAELFGAYGAQYQGVLAQASAFHEQFAAALASAATTYAGAEAAAASLLRGGAVSAGADAVGLFIGGSGLPVPPPSYLSAVLPWVNFNGANNVLLANAQALFTPEGLYPTTGVKSLPLNTSVAQGVQILESAITTQLPNSPVAVLGYSQSAIISSLVMQAALNGTYVPPTANPLTFTLLGDPMAPNGGLFERFVGLQLPSVGLNFYGATPPNTPYPTNIYTLQYDGYADFPKYPGNFIADLNAFAGILEVHGTYPSIDPSALPPGDTLIQLPTSPGYTGSTKYWMITQPNLPLLDPIRAIPGIGNPIADLLQPDLRAIVNYGYGNPYYGYNTGYADVPTPFSVFPPLSDTMLLGPALTAGTQQGITAFVSDISHLGTPSLASMPLSMGAGGGSSLGAFSLPTTLPTLPPITPSSIIGAIQTANTEVFGALSADLSSAYSVLLPTADIANALLISLPSYDVNLFLSGVQMAIGGDPTGGLAYAFGAPIAADIAIGTLAAGFELEVIVNAVTAIV
jgi:hypothetical protein